jgi:hypothetical protein
MALKFQKNPHHNPAPVVSHFTWQRAGRSEENDGTYFPHPSGVLSGLFKLNATKKKSAITY